MVKIFALCIIFCYPCFAFASQPQSVVLVNDNFITLSDLFGKFGVTSNTIIGKSPELGKKFLVDAQQVRRIVQLYNLHPAVALYPNGLIIERITKFIHKMAILSAIVKKVSSNKKLKHAVFILQHIPSLPTPVSSSFVISISGFHYNLSSKIFDGVVHMVSDTKDVSGRISGYIKFPRKIFILKRSLGRGEAIKFADLTTKTIYSDSLDHDAVSTIGQIIGKSLKIPLQQGTAITYKILQIPEAVVKGSLVRVYMKTGRIIITTQGVAISSGKIGSTINVLNVKSNNIFEAIVRKINEVKVSPYSSPILYHQKPNQLDPKSWNYYTNMHR